MKDEQNFVKVKTGVFNNVLNWSSKKIEKPKGKKFEKKKFNKFNEMKMRNILSDWPSNTR